MSEVLGIDVTVRPSGSGCAECTATGGWWFHLRRCAQCGHVGCCDSSPAQHTLRHYQETGHPIIRSFEPGEEWFWSYEANDYYQGPSLAGPLHHPVDQPVPGPSGRVPADWERHLH